MGLLRCNTYCHILCCYVHTEDDMTDNQWITMFKYFKDRLDNGGRFRGRLKMYTCKDWYDFRREFADQSEALEALHKQYKEHTLIEDVRM